MLRDVAGVQSFRRSDSRSTHPTNQGISLRGLGGNASSRALLLLDGVPQSDPFGGWISFPAYSTDRIDQVRVTRGGGSGYFGPGALAGTIELESSGAATDQAVAGSVAIGSRDSLDGRASLALSGRGGFMTLSGAYARGDGFVPVVAADRGPVDRRAPYRQGSAAARAVFEITNDIEAQLNLSGFKDQRDRGLPFTDNRNEGVDGSVRIVGKGRTRWSLLGYVQTREFSSEFASVNAERTSVSPALDQFSVPSRAIGGRAEFAPLAGPVAVRLGVDARSVEGETREHFLFVDGRPTRRREAGGKSLTAGVFADGSWESGPLHLSVGARLDRWVIDEGHLRTFALPDSSLLEEEFDRRSGWEPTARIGLAWQGSRTMKLRAAVYRGWRLPTLNELYRPFRVGAETTAANALLEPERLAGAEIGADWTPAEAVRVSVTGFTNRLNHAIANVTLAPNSRRRENLDSIRSRGIEVDGAADLGRIAFRASYAFTDARVQASGIAAALDGRRPAQTPRHQASGTIEPSLPHGFQLALTGRLQSRQYEDDNNSRSLAAAATVDLFASAPLSSRIAVELRGENLTDEQVEAAISSDGIIERSLPRTFWIGLRLR